MAARAGQPHSAPPAHRHTRRPAAPEALGGQAQGARRVPGVLRARLCHRHRGGGKFFLVVHAAAPGEQPHPEGARGRGDIDSREDPSADSDDRRRTVHSSPDKARGAATRTIDASPDHARGSASHNVHAGPDNSGTRTASFFSSAP
jgi:hypothetical protein